MKIDTLIKSIISLMGVLGVNYLYPELLIIILMGVIVIIGISKIFQDTNKFIDCFRGLIRLERRSNTTNSVFIHERRHKRDSPIPFYVPANIYMIFFVVYTLLSILTGPFGK